MTTTEQKAVSDPLPHWDMTTVYPGLESPEFEAGFTSVIKAIGELKDLFDSKNIRKSASPEITPETVSTFETVTERYNALADALRTLAGYISSFVTTDSRNDLAQAKMSELQMRSVELQKLGTRYEAWLGSLDVEALINRSPLAQAHAFALRKAAAAAQHLMPEGEEELAATLNLSGGSSWVKLHGNVTSRLMVPVTYPNGEVKTMPMSAVRNLAFEPDPATRKAGYDAELKAWETVTVPLAAALNGIKGQVNTLNDRRGWEDSLAPALFDNNIDRATLDAMQAACRESFPDFRRYLQAKARLLGEEHLPWWDMFAPVGGPEAIRHWPYTEATAFIVQQFGTYSPRLAGLADRAFRQNWIDAEPRTGKRDGAFCMGLRNDESRILANYQYSYSGVSTLAHELGHAYHNLNLVTRTPLQRQTPMALAETASIFCQTIITNAMLKTTGGAEKLNILEEDLQDSCQVVVDIYSRFLFEKAVFEKRRSRDLSIDELNTLMLEAQRATYGDGLDQEFLHPYMWAVKSHYYSTGRSYYNWPYTFGLLFGLGLYARYLEDPEAFRAGYDDLLSSTGLYDAATLGQRFNIDIHSVDFWRSSLDVCRDHINQFEALVTESVKPAGR